MIHTVEVEPGDPHNDQLVARANEELDEMVESCRRSLADAPSTTDAVVGISYILRRDTVNMPRDRMSAMLGAALVRLAVADAAEAQP